MATWQATFYLVSREALKAGGDCPVHLGEEWWEPKVPQEVVFTLDKRLTPGESWCEEILGWGPYQGNRLEVGNIGGVRIRFNLCEPDPNFFDTVLWLAEETGSKLLSEDGEVLEATEFELRAALLGSSAALYAANPKGFLKGIQRTNEG